MNKLNTVSLFAGIGGFDLAFKKAGFNIIYANDFDKYACETYKANVGNIVCADIQNEKYNLPLHDVLIAGFPCQPFSLYGKLQGFPENWIQVVSDTQAYKQFGNTISVNVAHALAVEIRKYIERYGKKENI